VTSYNYNIYPFFKAFEYMKSRQELASWIQKHVAEMYEVRCCNNSGNHSLRGVTLGMPIPDLFRD
jgi:hypothetical protein